MRFDCYRMKFILSLIYFLPGNGMNGMAYLQVKSIDDELYKSLGKRAAMENRSITQEVISILKAHLSIPSCKTRLVNDQFLEVCRLC